MHTPGPWNVHVRLKREDECDPGLHIYNAETHRTVVDSGALDVWPLKPADKALLEAAPDLLEACKVALGDLLAHGMPLNSSTGKMLTDAIQKATGEPHA